MNDFEILGHIDEDGDVFCIDCNSENLGSPIFVCSEWDRFPVCCMCNEKIIDVALTPEGAIYEAETSHCEIFKPDDKTLALWSKEFGFDEPGWYWWSCFPGCLPDSEPCGPFDSKSAAAFDALGY